MRGDLYVEATAIYQLQTDDRTHRPRQKRKKKRQDRAQTFHHDTVLDVPQAVLGRVSAGGWRGLSEVVRRKAVSNNAQQHIAPVCSRGVAFINSLAHCSTRNGATQPA